MFNSLCANYKVYCNLENMRKIIVYSITQFNVAKGVDTELRQAISSKPYIQSHYSERWSCKL